MASATSPRGGGSRKAGLQHPRSTHHLSSRRGGGEHEGWAEGIASLTERHTATALLDDGAAGRLGAKPSGGEVRGRAGCWGGGEGRMCGSMGHAGTVVVQRCCYSHTALLTAHCSLLA